MTGNYLKVISPIFIMVIVIFMPFFCYGETGKEPAKKQSDTGAEVGVSSIPEKDDSIVDEIAGSILSEKAEKSSHEKAGSAKGRGTVILRRLAKCREFLQSCSVRLQWILGGRVKVHIIGRTKWRKCREAVSHYRKALAQLMEVPLSSFLYHPTAFVEASEFLRWGRKNAIAVESYEENFKDVIVVLPDFKRSLVKKKGLSTK